MKALIPIACLMFAQILFSEDTEKTVTETPWNLAAVYENSVAIFYGKLDKSIPEPKYKTGVMGVDVTDIEAYELPLEEIVWWKAKELTFTVKETFKGGEAPSSVAYVPDQHPTIWTHVQSAAGEDLLVQPKEPSRLLEFVHPRDEGLFFVRHYLGSTIPVLYEIRLGQNATDDMAILRQFKQAGGSIPIEYLIKLAEDEKIALKAREAKAYKLFENEYYKILRIQDLDIRKSMLNDLIARMGFEGRWDYYKFKDEYLKLHGHEIDAKDIPRGPTDGLEKLWHDVSGELDKLDVINKAREKSKQ